MLTKMMYDVLVTIILSFIPVSELRGGMTYGLLRGIDPLLCFFIAVITNIIAVFFVFFFLDFLHKYFMKINFYRKVFGYFHEKAKKKAEGVKSSMMVYGYLALAIFVAIPLPATGAWTGILIAWVLGLERKKSILAVSAGVLVAGVIVFILVTSGTKIAGII